MRHESPARVIASPGRLPAFWDRRAVFVANLLGLFFGNEVETRALAEEVGEVDSYGGRLIPILDLLFRGGGNLLVLERRPDVSLCEYFSGALGLSLPQLEILPHRDYLEIGKGLQSGEGPEHPVLETLRAHGAKCMDGYVTDDTLSALARRLGKDTISTCEGSRRGNNKRLLHLFLEEQGLPVVRTEIAESPGSIVECLQRLHRAGFSSAVVKAAIGASGIGMVKIEPLSTVFSVQEQVPGHFFFEGPCLVQGWLKPGELGVRRLRSPSVQMFLGDDSVALYDLTEQILSKASVHEGNESPPPYLEEDTGLKEELLRQGGVAGQWLHRQGYRGTASADFLVADYEDRTTVYVCEINARVTGATYPSILARHFLPDGAWLLRNLRFARQVSGKELFSRLRGTGCLFGAGNEGRGIMPVNFNFGSDGLVHKGQFLCVAPDGEGCRILLEKAERDLECIPDRD